MAMFAVNKYFPTQFTVAVLNATLDLAALVLVGVAAFFGSEVVLAPLGSLHVRCKRKTERMTIYCRGRALGQRPDKWSRCLRAASAEPTRAYAVEPRQIPRNHLSYSYISLYASPAAHTPATSSNYICTYMHRQASWQFTYSFTS